MLVRTGETLVHDDGLFPLTPVHTLRPQPGSQPAAAEVALSCSFEDGKAGDASGNQNHGTVDGAQKIDGKIGMALRFRGTREKPNSDSFVKHHWTRDLQMLVRAMVKAGDSLFIVGPPDLIDEESTFQRIVNKDATVEAQLAEQNAALNGERGGLLQVVSATDGSMLAVYKVDYLPTWDGLAAANGRLHLTTTDGRVVCLAAP